MSKAALPELQKAKGNIITAGSESGVLGIAQNAPYGGTKGFNCAFTRGVAAEQAQRGVRCNIVVSGPIDTGWTHKKTGPMDSEMEQMVTHGALLGRRGTPEEVANVCLFQASDEASYVPGAVWPVDGGTLIAKSPAGDMAADSMKQQPEGDLNLEHSKNGHTSIRK